MGYRMIVTTRSGVPIELNPDVLNDMELVDALADMQSGDPLGMSAVAKMVFGDKLKAVYDSIRSEDGRVHVDVFTAELIAFFNAIGDNGKKF